MYLWQPHGVQEWLCSIAAGPLGSTSTQAMPTEQGTGITQKMDFLIITRGAPLGGPSVILLIFLFEVSENYTSP